MDIFEKFKSVNTQKRRQMLKTWDIEYYENDMPSITDEMYDMCLRYFNEHAKVKYTSSLGTASERFPKYEHKYPVLSLDKIVTKSKFMSAAKAFDYNCVIEPKLDGLTVVYYPDGKLVSRGNGHIGEILNADREIPGLPNPYSLPIRLEAVITKKDFEKFFKNNLKARNLAAGILRRKLMSEEEIAKIPQDQNKKIENELKKRREVIEALSHITYYAYNILGADDMSEEEQMYTLKKLGFHVPVVQIIKSEEELDKAFDNMELWSKSQEYETDGAVVKANMSKKEKDFGGTAHHPNNAFAFKFVSMTEETVLKKIRWSMGYDRLTPVAQFDDVMLGGSSVTQASMHNLNIIDKLGAKIGSKITVTLKNEIIPQVISCDKKGIEIDIPTECPYCKNRLSINNTKEIICNNPDCKAKYLDTMKRIAGKNGLNIEGLSEDILDAIYRVAKMDKLDMSSPFTFLTYDKDVLKKAYDLVYITKARLVAERLLYLYEEQQKGKSKPIEISLFPELCTDVIEKVKEDIRVFNLVLPNPRAKTSGNNPILMKVRGYINSYMEFEDFELKVSEEDKQKASEIHERPLAATIIGMINKRRSDVLSSNFLFACNIPELGINTAKEILKNFKDLDDFINNWTTVIEGSEKKGKKMVKVEKPRGLLIEGIGKTIYPIITGALPLIKDNMKYIKTFAPNNLYLTPEDAKKEAQKPTFCISGRTSQTKSYYEKLIIEAGGIYVTSVIKDLSYLVSNENNTVKVQKAQKNGVTILNEEALVELLDKIKANK